MLTLYGLTTCDTCRLARKQIENSGRTVVFQDVRKNPLSQDQLARFVAEFSGALVNRRSTTWRNLSEAERIGTPETLIARHPTLMKRPVIEDGGALTLGWDKTAKDRHLG
ncbi:MAG: arsenate reductase [Silicimonas sp.]|nr:arsenate reductase [Silicimonas sp.]